MALKTAILPYKLQLEDGEPLRLPYDPPPIPDAMLQNPSIIYAYESLILYASRREGVFFDTNTFVYYDKRDRNRRVAPDLYVALGVDEERIRERNGYLVWEVDKPPDFVMEVASPTTARNDLTAKRALYADLGVGENWLLDPTGGELYGEPLIGEILVDGVYRRLPTRTTSEGDVWIHSPTLGVALCWAGGRLRIYDPETGEFLRDHLESEEDRLQERRGRLEAEAEMQVERRGRLEAEAEMQLERRGRLAVEAENRRLRERLRRLGGE